MKISRFIKSTLVTSIAATVVFCSTSANSTSMDIEKRTVIKGSQYTSLTNFSNFLQSALAAEIDALDKVLTVSSQKYAALKIAVKTSKASVADQSGTIDPIITGSIANSFFGTVAIPFSGISSHSDWEKVRDHPLSDEVSRCAAGTCGARATRLVQSTKTTNSFFELLKSVNATANAEIRYVPDSEGYQSTDYWATANETVRNGLGDCEDFAILKYAMLRKAGIPAKSLSLVILKDKARGLYHAVLAISTNQGHFILDNVRNDIYRDTSIKNYKPLYSFSTDRTWIHGYPADSSNKIASAPLNFNSIAPGESSFDASIEISGQFMNFGDLRPVVSPLN